MSHGGPRPRPATPADFPALEAIYVATDPPRPDEPMASAGWMARYLDFLFARGEMLVEDGESGPIGFAAVVDVGRAIHVADLFVHPAQQGRGVGARLLRAALGDRWPRMTFSSDDPRAMPLYIRTGMLPRWPNLYLDSKGRGIPAAPPSFSVRAVRPDEASATEVGFGGLDRLADYEHWAGQPGAQSFVVEEARRPVAVGNGRDRWRIPGRWIDRLIIDPSVDDVVGPVLAALEFAASGQPISIAIAGPHPAVRVLVEGGFQLYDKDTFMASEDGLLDPLHHIVDPGVP